MEGSEIRGGQIPGRWRNRVRGSGRRRKPRRWRDLPDGAWKRIVRRTFDQYRADGVTNLAAALTYRSVLALFPGLIALVALLGCSGSIRRPSTPCCRS